jgi:hypothetical protein
MIMAIKSNILVKGKSCDYGLVNKVTYFSAEPADLSLDDHVPANIPAVPVGGSLIVMPVRSPWISINRLIIYTGANQFAANTVLNFGLYLLLKDIGSVPVNEGSFLFLGNLASTPAMAQAAQNSTTLVELYKHLPIEVSLPAGGVVDAQITAITNGFGYKEAVNFVQTIPDGADPDEAQANTENHIGALVFRDAAENYVGGWPTRTRANIRAATDAAIDAIVVAIHGAAHNTLAAFKAAVVAMYTDVIKNAETAGWTFKASLYSIEDYLTHKSTPLYFGIANAAANAGIPAQMMFGFEYSDSMAGEL